MSYKLKILVASAHFEVSAKSKKAAEEAAVDAGVNGIFVNNYTLYFPPHKVDRIKIEKVS